MKKIGFSLIELLIVMLILAGLAAMSIPNMGDSEEAMIKRTMENDLRNAIAEKQIEQIDNI